MNFCRVCMMTHHGESCDVSDDSDDDDVSFNDEEAGSDNMNGGNDDDDADADLDEMLDNIGQGTWGDKWKTSAESSSFIDKDLESLRRLLDDSHQELYTGCQSYKKILFIVTMLHLKTTNGWSNKSFYDTIDVFKKALPSPSSFPKNFYEEKKYIQDLGFRGDKILASVNDCVLYREVSNDMRWHKDVRVNDDNVATHPADSEALKHFKREFSLFAHYPRNVCLGLATERFNPLGTKVSDVRGLQVDKESTAQSSLRRGSNPLELVDGITFSSDSTGKASKTRLLIDEENIDDEETDPSNLESSKKEGSSQEDESS
ncbi:leucine-rich repeat protein [Tanacetum coccineum]|uniref:Leucine-rich repeat protein n=1 Tax=Tanacetum coccineum TaxID=301880 RepID=A0ABQ5AX99_9ASTR